MSRKGPVLDDLWHLFRPALSQNTFKRHNIPFSAARQSRRLSPVPLTTISRCLHKQYSSNATQFRDGRSEQSTTGNDPDTEHFTPLKQRHRPDSERYFQSGKSLVDADVPVHLKAEKPAQLEARLTKIANESPKITSILPILLLLIRDHKIRPTLQHYRALIQCNVDSVNGSTGNVKRLLEEMDEHGIIPDSATYHAALQVLAVHPDYLLQQEILRIMRDKWLPLSPDGWHYVVAGQIRGHQFELALDNIANMERKDIAVEDWLFSLLIYNLCAFEREMDQVLQLLKSRLSQGHTLTHELWTQILDTASSISHYELTSFVWKRAVELGEFDPDPRLYAQVLGAVFHDGGDLIDSVLRLMAYNKITPQIDHYEQWCAARVATGNIHGAIFALCEMQKAGYLVEPSSTREIVKYCVSNKTRPQEIWRILRDLKARGHVIPMACARVFIELCEATAAEDPFQVDDGMSFYKQIHMLCPQRPDTAFYNALISMCRVAKNPESALFVVEEMASFGVLPDTTTFELLVLICLDNSNFESSYLYAEDMQEQGFDFRQDVRVKIRERCVESSNEYAVRLRNLPGVSKDVPTVEKNTRVPEELLSRRQKAELKYTKEHNKLRRQRKRQRLALEKQQQSTEGHVEGHT
ncbi:hypothetical protein BJY04DRAFT_200522 [Aspergillus karnatakaensis]|uniref:pentatricopeptide repeat protein n=1 Tax=Aspergillus karnatakaensis TaxID=1810916 RepID=UPI003CCD7C12